MKKIIAIVLVALMAVPFAVLSSAAIVPAEPTLSNTEVNIYVSDGTTSGVQAAETNPGTKESPNNRFNKACEFVKTTGGSYIIPGKGYVPKTYGDTSFPATTSPVRITAVDPVTNTRYNPDKIVDSADKTNGQKGMFMIQNSADASNVAKFFGEYIFDNISILDRSSATTQPATLSVEDGGKIVVKNTVDVIKALEAGKTSILNVNAGGYAYLHAAGFSDYTGNGTIVLDPALVSSGAVTKAAEII